MAAETRSAESRFGELALIFIVVLAAGLLMAREAVKQADTRPRKITIERMLTIEEALARYMIDTGGVLPTTEQGLQALIARPTLSPHPRIWDGPYIEDEQILRDGWGREFLYYAPGKALKGYEDFRHPYSLLSYGSDGAERGDHMAADILSWDRTTMIP